MLSLEQFRLEIKKERSRMKRREMQTEFVRGMSEGLLLALKTAETIFRQNRIKVEIQNPWGWRKKKAA